MHHSHLFHLLVIMLVLFWSGEAAITPQMRQQHGNQRLLSNDDVTTKDTAIYNFVNERNEERAVTMPSMSKLKDLPGKSSSFIKKVMNLHNADIVTTADKNHILKNMAAALEKNPSSLKKLVKDPKIIRSSASLDKRVVRFKKDDISTLRQIFAKNPVKANKFDAGIKLIENAMTGVVAVGVVTLLILALLTVVSATN